MTTSNRLGVLEAVAAVVDDPIRFLAVIGQCRNEAEARVRIMAEYGVSLDAVNHMLETPFRRVLTSHLGAHPPGDHRRPARPGQVRGGGTGSSTRSGPFLLVVDPTFGQYRE